MLGVARLHKPYYSASFLKSTAPVRVQRPLGDTKCRHRYNTLSQEANAKDWFLGTTELWSMLQGEHTWPKASESLRQCAMMFAEDQ